MSIEFRPDTLIRKYNELLAESLHNFCDPQTNQLRSEYSEVIHNCPACKGIDLIPYIQKGPLHYKSCGNCRSIFQAPAFRMKPLKQWYASSKASQMGEKIRFETYDSRKTKKFLPRSNMAIGDICHSGVFSVIITAKEVSLIIPAEK